MRFGGREVDPAQVIKDPATWLPILVSIDIDNLEEELRHQATLVAFAVVEYEKAKAAESRAKAHLSKVTGRLRLAAETSQWKADAAAEQSEEYQTALQDHTFATYRVGIFKGLLGALDHKKDMLVQIAARRRVEAAAHPG